MGGVAKQNSYVNECDSNLPDLLVHVPIVLDRPELATIADQSKYLEEVRTNSKFFDIVGLGVYSVIREVTQIGTHNSESHMVKQSTAVKDYIGWLCEWVPAREQIMVLQGFSYADEYEPVFFAHG